MTLTKYYLRENPFDIYSHVHRMANRKEEWEKIRSSLITGFDGRGPRFFVIQGDYGMGKTYMLEQIYRWISGEEYRDKVFVAKVLAEKLAVMVSEPKWQKFGLNLITRIFDTIERKKLIDVLKKVPLDDSKLKFKEVFEGLKKGEEVAFRYITGQKLSPKELRDLNLDSPLSDSPTGLRLFFEFLRVIKLAGYDNFLLLLDEFEFIPSFYGEKKITQILNTFREIFDDFGKYENKEPNGLAKPIFVFAISPGGWDRLKELEESSRKKTGGGGIAPFMERISKKDFIWLKPFALENTIELIELRISEARTKEVDDPLFPFTRESVEYIHKVSNQKPRDVIQYCKIILEDAFKESLDRIDFKSTKKILDTYGMKPLIKTT